jgi:signal peptidase
MENKKKSTIFDVLTTVITIIIILIAVVAMLFRTSVLGIKFYGVLTSSMDGGYEAEGNYPESFKKNDLLIIDLVSETESKNLQAGQIICFYTFVDGERIINTHRIMQIRKDTSGEVVGYFTAGDNNLITVFGEKREIVSEYFNESPLNFDTGISTSDIIGVYKSKLNGAGSIINFFQSKNGFLVFVVLPCFLIMIYCVYLFIKALDNYKKEKYALVEQEKEALFEAKKKEEINKILELEREKIRQELIKEAQDKKMK